MKNVSVKKMNGKGKNALRAVLIVVALIFATCFAFAACATGEDVQIEKVTSASEINRLIAKANFTAENAVRDKMEGRFGALSDYSYNDGRATADIEKDGKSYSVTVEIEVDESDFSVTRYKNATRSGDSLIYTQNGEEVTYNVADKIIVEENGYFYVIDVSGANAEIDRAVSAAILTEKGGSQEETPDTQIEPIEDINVIEQLLRQKDLSIEALAKAAATAFYGQDNVSNLSYQNGIVSGQAKTAEGTVNFSANLDLSATDFEGKFYVGTKLGADGKTLTFYQNGTSATLTITEDMAVIETADGVNILDTAAAEQMVANKFETTNNETSAPSQDITFDSWQELVDLIGIENESTLEQAMAEIIKKNLVTLDFVQWVVGSYSGGPETTLENTDTLKLAFKLNQNQEIESISWMGVRYAFRSDTEDHLRVVTVPLTSPISYKTIKVTENLAEDQENDNCISFRDITLDLSNYANEILYDKNAITVDQLYYGSHSLTDTNQAYFDLCMPLAVEAGLIDANVTLGFVSVQVSGGVIGSEFGNAINANLQFIDLNTNIKYNISILFADSRTNGSTTMLDEMKKSADSGEYRARSIEDDKTIISGDIIYEFEDVLDGIVKYTIPAENQK